MTNQNEETAQKISDLMNALQQLIAELDNEEPDERLISELDTAYQYLETAFELINK